MKRLNYTQLVDQHISYIILILLFFIALPTAHAFSVNVPTTISPEAQALLKKYTTDPTSLPAPPSPSDFNGWKKVSEQMQAQQYIRSKTITDLYKPSLNKTKINNIPVIEVKPKGYVTNDRIIVYVHGGLSIYSANSSIGNAILVANATGLKTILVDYTRAPFSKWNQTTDEIIKVIMGLNANVDLKNITVLGSGAGGIIAPSAILKMRDRGLGLIGSVVLWSPWVDLTETGDTFSTLKGKDPLISYSIQLKNPALVYANQADQKNPYVSPVYGDYSKGFPRTLIQGGTKEVLLSGFIRMYQNLDNNGIPVKLDLYEGMPHVFQVVFYTTLESKLALEKVKEFISK